MTTKPKRGDYFVDANREYGERRILRVKRILNGKAICESTTVFLLTVRDTAIDLKRLSSPAFRQPTAEEWEMIRRWSA